MRQVRVAWDGVGINFVLASKDDFYIASLIWEIEERLGGGIFGHFGF